MLWRHLIFRITEEGNSCSEDNKIHCYYHEHKIDGKFFSILCPSFPDEEIICPNCGENFSELEENKSEEFETDNFWMQSVRTGRFLTDYQKTDYWHVHSDGSKSQCLKSEQGILCSGCHKTLLTNNAFEISTEAICFKKKQMSTLDEIYCLLWLKQAVWLQITNDDEEDEFYRLDYYAKEQIAVAKKDDVLLCSGDHQFQEGDAFFQLPEMIDSRIFNEIEKRMKEEAKGKKPDQTLEVDMEIVMQDMQNWLKFLKQKGILPQNGPREIIAEMPDKSEGPIQKGKGRKGTGTQEFRPTVVEKVTELQSGQYASSSADEGDETNLHDARQEILIIPPEDEPEIDDRVATSELTSLIIDDPPAPAVDITQPPELNLDEILPVNEENAEEDEDKTPLPEPQELPTESGDPVQQQLSFPDDMRKGLQDLTEKLNQMETVDGEDFGREVLEFLLPHIEKLFKYEEITIRKILKNIIEITITAEDIEKLKKIKEDYQERNEKDQKEHNRLMAEQEMAYALTIQNILVKVADFISETALKADEQRLAEAKKIEEWLQQKKLDIQQWVTEQKDILQKVLEGTEIIRKAEEAVTAKKDQALKEITEKKDAGIKELKSEKGETIKAQSAFTEHVKLLDDQSQKAHETRESTAEEKHLEREADASQKHHRRFRNILLAVSGILLLAILSGSIILLKINGAIKHKFNNLVAQMQLDKQEREKQRVQNQKLQEKLRSTEETLKNVENKAKKLKKNQQKALENLQKLEIATSAAMSLWQNLDMDLLEEMQKWEELFYQTFWEQQLYLDYYQEKLLKKSANQEYDYWTLLLLSLNKEAKVKKDPDVKKLKKGLKKLESSLNLLHKTILPKLDKLENAKPKTCENPKMLKKLKNLSDIVHKKLLPKLNDLEKRKAKTCPKTTVRKTVKKLKTAKKQARPSARKKRKIPPKAKVPQTLWQIIGRPL